MFVYVQKIENFLKGLPWRLGFYFDDSVRGTERGLRVLGGGDERLSVDSEVCVLRFEASTAYSQLPSPNTFILLKGDLLNENYYKKGGVYFENAQEYTKAYFTSLQET